MNPIFLQIGDFPIAWYGVMTMLGLLAGAALAVALGRRAGFSDLTIIDLCLCAVAGMIVGARLLYIITVWPDFVAAPADYLFNRQGFVFLGGLIGAVAACAWYIRRHRLPFWRLADVFAPAVPLGHALGRIGCHITGCCHGGVCTPGAWYGIEYPLTTAADGMIVGGYAVIEQAEAGLIPPDALMSLGVFPVQLMEAALLFALAGAMAWVVVRGAGWPGRAFLTYLMVYGVARFGLEFLRGDSGRGVWELGPIAVSSSQLLSVAIVAGAGWGWRAGRRGRLPGQHTPMPTPMPEAEASDKPAPSPIRSAPRAANPNGRSAQKGAARKKQRSR